MTCFYCGTELPAGAMFCGECGRPVNTKGGRSSRASAKAAAAEAVVAVDEPVGEPVAESDVDPVVEAREEAPAVLEEAPAAIEEAEPEAAAEPITEPEPESDASVEPEPEPEPEPAPVAEPEPERELAPVPESAALPEPVAVAAPAPEPAAPRSGAHDATAAADRCAQCGAPLGPSDIFCPECGYVRQRGSARSRPSDTNILDPFPWGLPRSTEPVAHQHAPVAFEPEEAPRPVATDAKPFADVADVAETRLVPRGARGERFVLQFSTGESVSVSGTGLIGRNPVAEPGEYFDTLVPVIDPGRSVSKTHLEFGQDGTSFWVSDRYSGNGTVVREPDREPRRCEAGKRYRVARGARVEIGEQFFIVS